MLIQFFWALLDEWDGAFPFFKHISAQPVGDVVSPAYSLIYTSEFEFLNSDTHRHLAPP